MLWAPAERFCQLERVKFVMKEAPSSDKFKLREYLYDQHLLLCFVEAGEDSTLSACSGPFTLSLL